MKNLKDIITSLKASALKSTTTNTATVSPVKLTNSATVEVKENQSTPNIYSPTVERKAKESALNTESLTKVIVASGFEVLPNKEPHRCSALTDVQTWYILREGYYLGYDVIAGAFALSDRHSIADDRFFLDNHVFNIYKKDEWKNGKLVRTQLSRVEFDELLKAKLPWKILQRAYLWDANRTTWPQCVGVRFNIKTPTLVM